MKGSPLKSYIMQLLKEPSTYRGVAMLLSACGIAMNPDQVAAISALGLGAAGAIGAFFRDF